MNTFMLTVATPDGSRFSGEVEGLFVRGTEGDLAILAGHTPFITAVRPGACRIELPDDTDRTATLDGGLLTVSKERVTLLSGSFRWDEE
ncbi:MAG: F0F1 ATP synthase subunit epsilon [Clostridia bacterium]|nr:F0F1 ATP synthase subunit epsilon [Clostridia bacterium]